MAEQILTISLKEYKKEIDDLRASLLGLEQSSDEYKKVASEIQQMQDKLNEVMRVGKTYTDAQEGSYNALTQTMSQLKKEWRATTDETQRNELGKQINNINDQLKTMDASIGIFGRNVGNYANSFKSAFSEMGNVGKVMGNEVGGAVEQVGGKINILSKALNVLKAHPVIAVIAVIVGLLMKCYNAFKSTEDGANKLSQAFSKMNGVSAVFEKAMQLIGAVIANTVIPVFNALLSVITTVVEGFGKIISWFGDITGNGTLAEIGKTMEDIKDSTEDAYEIEKLRLNIARQTRALRVKEAKEMTVINDLRAKAQDKENYSLKERKKFAQEAYEKEQNILKEKLAIAKANVQLIKQEMALANTNPSKEQLDALADAQIAVYNIQSEMANAQRTHNKEINRMNKEGKKDASDASKQQEIRNKAQEKYLEYLKKESEIRREIVRDDSDYAYRLKQKEEEVRYEKEISAIENQKGASQAKINKEKEIAYKDHYIKLLKLNEDYCNKVTENIKNMQQTEAEVYKYNNKYEYDYQYYDDLEKISNKYYINLAENAREAFEERTKLLREYYNNEEDLSTRSDIDKSIQLELVLLLQQIDSLRIQKNDKITQLRREQWEAEKQQLEQQYNERYQLESAEVNKLGVQMLNVERSNTEKRNELRKQMESAGFDALATYQDNIVNVAATNLDKIKEFGKLSTESVEEYNQRIIDAEAQLRDALNAQNEALYNYNYLTNSNNNFEQLIHYQISESVDALRMAKFELNNIYQEEGEAFEEYLQRKLQAQEKYNQAFNNRVKAEISSWSRLANGVANITDTIVQIDNDRLQNEVENGKISEAQAKEQFEHNKQFQYASAVISMLASAAGIYFDTIKDHTIQPTYLRIPLAAIQYASVLATGISQINQIKQQSFNGSYGGGSSSSMSNGIMSASVTPLLDEKLDSNSYNQLNTDSNSSQSDTRVYLVESDVREMNNRVEVRDSQSTF